MYDGYYIQVKDKQLGGDSFAIPEPLFDAKLFEKTDEPPRHPHTGEPLSAKPRKNVASKGATSKEN